jgi:multidrug efflux pump subunit AcrA (membrane-fusion protein)
MKVDDIHQHLAPYYHKVKPYYEKAKPYYNQAKVYIQKNMIKKYFFIGILGWILFGRWLYSGSTTTTTSLSEYTVATGNIQNTIEAYGSIELVDEQKIRFNQQGEVTKVYFKKWSDIKKWDIIAELDQGSVESNILQAEISLQNARLQLDETVNGDRSTAILQAENNLEQSKLKLDIAQQEYDNLSWDLNNSGTVTDTETTMANARLSIQNYIIEGDKKIEQMSDILSKYDYQQYIWAQDQDRSSRIAVDNAMITASNKYTALKWYFATGLTSTDDRSKLVIW